MSPYDWGNSGDSQSVAVGEVTKVSGGDSLLEQIGSSAGKLLS
jgi:hypothetical protein